MIDFVCQGFENRIVHLAKILSKETLVRLHVIKSPGLFGQKPSGVDVIEYQPSIGPVPVIKRLRLRQKLAKEIASNRLDDNSTMFISSPPSLLAPLTGKFNNSILDIRDTWQYWNHHGKIKRVLEKREQLQGMKHAKLVSYVHPLMRKLLPDNGKLFLSSNGANRDIFKRIGKTVKLEGSDLNLVYAGGIDHYHGINILVDLMEQLRPGIHLTIAGTGRAADELEEKLYHYKRANITFYNTVFRQEELAIYVRSADYTVSTMSRNNSAWYSTAVTLKSYESLSCGTPVISFGGLGMSQLLNDHYYFPSFNFDREALFMQHAKHQLNNLFPLNKYQKIELAERFFLRHSYQETARQLLRVIKLHGMI